jgi:hypothetical protein
MIRQVFAQGDINYLLQLFDTYTTFKDDSQILKVCCKIIQRSDNLNNKEKLIEIFDTIYAIVSKERMILRNVLELEKSAIEDKNLDKQKYLNEYKQHLSGTITDTLRKIVRDIMKAISIISNNKVNSFFTHYRKKMKNFFYK